MANHAIIDTTQTVTVNNITGNPIINVVAWDEEKNPDYDFHAGHGYDDGLIAVQSDTAGIGHIYDPATKTITNPYYNQG